WNPDFVEVGPQLAVQHVLISEVEAGGSRRFRRFGKFTAGKLAGPRFDRLKADVPQVCTLACGDLAAGLRANGAQRNQFHRASSAISNRNASTSLAISASMAASSSSSS